MTIEIRQMVIKSSVGSGADKNPAKSTGKTGAANDDCGCGEDCEGGAGSQERQKMRSAISMEWERMRER